MPMALSFNDLLDQAENIPRLDPMIDPQLQTDIPPHLRGADLPQDVDTPNEDSQDGNSSVPRAILFNSTNQAGSKRNGDEVDLRVEHASRKFKLNQNGERVLQQFSSVRYPH